MSSTMKCAPQFLILDRSWLVQTVMTVAPLATPARMPEGESSKTTRFFASRQRHLAARRNGPGAGLPALTRLSSAVMVTGARGGGGIPTRVIAPYAYVLAPEVATAYRPVRMDDHLAHLEEDLD
ncbi:hypothetical protein ACEPAI_6687 [Sanghuangporus weigelae]